MVIGCERQYADELLEKIMTQQRLREKLTEDREDKLARQLLDNTQKEIENSPLQEILALEIVAQLEMFVRIAKEQVMDEKVISAMEKMKETLQKRVSEVGGTFGKNSLTNDLLFNLIKDRVSRA